MNLMQEISARAGRDLAAQLDSALMGEIVKRIGPVPDLEVLRGRLTEVKVVGHEESTYCLDDEPILIVHPVEVKHDGYTFHATQRVQGFSDTREQEVNKAMRNGACNCPGPLSSKSIDPLKNSGFTFQCNSCGIRFKFANPTNKDPLGRRVIAEWRP